MADRQAGPTKPELVIPLLLETVGAKPKILQEASTDNGGVMRVRVPFYIGGSITRAPNFPKPILFQEKILPAIIQEGTRRIETKRPPLTVYARHSHAVSGSHLPIGAVTALEQEGGIGYATLDILSANVPDGAHAQALITQEMLDSVSLRANEYTLSNASVNGKSMLVCEGLAMAGIDMAPDQPAQDTYGMVVLTQEAVVIPEPADQPKPQRRPRVDEPVTLTLEAVQAEPKILAEIERPFREQLAAVTKERDDLILQNGLRERDALIQEISGKTSNAEEFATTIKNVCEQKGVKDAAGVHALVAPYLLQEVDRLRTATTTTPAESDAQKLSRLFSVSGAGSATAGVTNPDDDKAPVLTQEVIASRGTIGGMLIPEDES